MVTDSLHTAWTAWKSWIKFWLAHTFALC